MHKKIVCALLSSFLCMCVRGAAETQDISGFLKNPLMAAIYNNDFPQVQFLVEHGADVNQKLGSQFNEFTPLMMASSLNNHKIMNYLLAHGADIDAVNKNEDTALEVALFYTDAEPNLETIQMLKNAGADINRYGKYRYTPLVIAAGNKKYNNALKVLIDAGADVNFFPENGLLPLDMALSATNPEAVRMLIQAGAHVDDKINKRIKELISTELRNKYFGEAKNKENFYNILQVMVKKLSPDVLNYGLLHALDAQDNELKDLFIRAGAELRYPTEKQQKAKERPQEIVKQSKKEALEMQKFFETTKEVEMPKELIGIMSDFFVSPEEEKKEKAEEEAKEDEARKKALSSLSKKSVRERMKDFFRRKK